MRFLRRNFLQIFFLSTFSTLYSPLLLFLINLIKFNASQFNKSLIVLFNLFFLFFLFVTPSYNPVTSTRAKRLTISRDFYCSLFNFFTQLFLLFMHDNCFVKILILRERLKWKRYLELMAQTPSVPLTQNNHSEMKIIIHRFNYE